MPAAVRIDATEVRARLVAWHDPSARRLAWREGCSAWGILVSEIMAQQTQAERAAVAWTAFMDRFPTPAALAAAPTADVIAQWKGLGYNRRAINLQRCAAAIVADHDGEVPQALAPLLDLPGIGPYTARAVMAFAFDAPVVPVDTNVARVLSRVAGLAVDGRTAQAHADRLLTTGDGGSAIAAAVMDLGATVCTARAQQCDACPLRPVCSWVGGATRDPAASSAHRSKPQGRFEGSRRQARGRVVDALRSGARPTAEVQHLIGAHGGSLIDGLLSDGLIERTDGGFALPGWSGKS